MLLPHGGSLVVQDMLAEMPSADANASKLRAVIANVIQTTGSGPMNPEDMEKIINTAKVYTDLQVCVRPFFSIDAGNLTSLYDEFWSKHAMDWRSMNLRIWLFVFIVAYSFHDFTLLVQMHRLSEESAKHSIEASREAEKHAKDRKLADDKLAADISEMRAKLKTLEGF